MRVGVIFAGIVGTASVSNRGAVTGSIRRLARIECEARTVSNIRALHDLIDLAYHIALEDTDDAYRSLVG